MLPKSFLKFFQIDDSFIILFRMSHFDFSQSETRSVMEVSNIFFIFTHREKTLLFHFSHLYPGLIGLSGRTDNLTSKTPVTYEFFKPRAHRTDELTLLISDRIGSLLTAVSSRE